MKKLVFQDTGPYRTMKKLVFQNTGPYRTMKKLVFQDEKYCIPRYRG
jgi:hypothetical protein